MKDIMGSKTYLTAFAALVCTIASPLTHAQTGSATYESFADLYDSFEACLPAARLGAQQDGYILEGCKNVTSPASQEAAQTWVCKSSKRSGQLKGCTVEGSTESHHALESGREFVCEKVKRSSGGEKVALYMIHAYSKAFSASVLNSRDGKTCRSAVWQSNEMSRYYDLCPTGSRGRGPEPVVMRDRDVVATGGAYYFGRNQKSDEAPHLSSRPETVSTIHYFKGKGGRPPCDYAQKPTREDRESTAPLSTFVDG